MEVKTARDRFTIFLRAACAAGRLFLVNEAETPSYRDYTGFQYFQPARSAVHLLDFSAVAKAAEQRKPQKLTVQKLQSLQSRNPSVSSIGALLFVFVDLRSRVFRHCSGGA